MNKVALSVRPERRLFRPRSSRRYLLVTLATERDAAASPGTGQRVAIVIDTSLSMAPFEAEIRKAVKAVLETLTESDEVACVTFNDEVRVVQPLAPASADVIRRIGAASRRLDFAAGSRFRKGWLTGCLEIAEQAPGQKAPASRCWVISDGGDDALGLAPTAHDVFEHTGIATSLISDNLRLRSIACPRGTLYKMSGLRRLPAPGRPLESAKLELEVPDAVLVEVLGPHHLSPAGTNRWRLVVDDLRSGEMRHVVFRLVFREYEEGGQARVVVSLGDDTQSVRFRCASHAECDREPRDIDVLRLIAVPRAENLWRLAQEYERSNLPARAYGEIAYACRILEKCPDAPGAQELLDDLGAEAKRLYKAQL